jgi:modulator of FtsH protease HflC
MNIFKNIFGILAVVVAFVAYSSYFVVDEREKALVLRFGEINRTVDQPGLYFKIPFADTVTFVEDRIVIWENNDIAVQDIASQVYMVDAITLAKITNTQLFRETLGADMSQAELRVAARLNSALRQTYGRRTFDAALSTDRAVMMLEIRDELRKEAETFGIDIVDVRVRRTDQDEKVLDQTFKRMESERNSLATDIRSKGEATKTRMNAETDRTYTTKIADAQRQADIIRGEGDGERNKVFAKAFQQDPEFFSFYRSMQAYSKSLGADGTTLVLDPNSEFFKYFGFQKESGTKPAAPAQ